MEDTGPPPGFAWFESGDAEVVCRAECEGAFREALAAGSLYAWARAHPSRRELRGRAPAYAVPLPGGCADVVVRHSWHGGVLAPLTRDLFLPPTRAPREMRTSIALAAAGVRTPEVVGYAVYRAGPLFRRADVATRLVAGGRDLAIAVAEGGRERTRVADGAVVGLAPWIRPTAALLHALAAAGAHHPDLNLKNVLLAPDADGDGEGWVLDVDVVRLAPPPVTPGTAWTVGAENYERLARGSSRSTESRADPAAPFKSAPPIAVASHSFARSPAATSSMVPPCDSRSPTIPAKSTAPGSRSSSASGTRCPPPANPGPAMT
jgi:3-deoxy-D-manno-octulosonic acid kinase